MNIIDQFKQKNILVIGDLMIDAYLWGDVERISPEAPVPLVSITKKDKRLGGAANVALNLKALNANVYVAGVCGKDSGFDTLKRLFDKEGINTYGVLPIESRPTTEKTRVFGHHQQMLRIDEEVTESLSSTENKRFIELIQEIFKVYSIDCLILEDYNKGTLNTENIPLLIELANQHGIPIVVDPKKDNFKLYQGISILKPNLKELKEGLKLDVKAINSSTLETIKNAFFKEFKAEILLLTLSEHGVFICNAKESYHVYAHKRDILDVSGAGDTVVSIAALCYILQLKLKSIASIANLAGGLVCEKVGVVPIDSNELLDEINKKQLTIE